MASIDDVRAQFLSFAKEHQDPQAIFDHMLESFANDRVAGLRTYTPEGDVAADLLALSWFREDDGTFNVQLVRQFDKGSDVLTLECLAKYNVEDDGLFEGEEICEDPAQLDFFRKLLEASPEWQTLRVKTPLSVSCRSR